MTMFTAFHAGASRRPLWMVAALIVAFGTGVALGLR
jgi:hypothetical protein